MEIIKKYQRLTLMLICAFGLHIIAIGLGSMIAGYWNFAIQSSLQNIFGTLANDKNFVLAYVTYWPVLIGNSLGILVGYFGTDTTMDSEQYKHMKPPIGNNYGRIYDDLSKGLNSICFFGCKYPIGSMAVAGIVLLPVSFISFYFGLVVVCIKYLDLLGWGNTHIAGFVMSVVTFLVMIIVTTIFMAIGANVGNFAGWVLGALIKLIGGSKK